MRDHDRAASQGEARAARRPGEPGSRRRLRSWWCTLSACSTRSRVCTRSWRVARGRGTLTLAASTTPGSYVLPSILECFAERHPRVEVDVVIGSSRWVAEREHTATCRSAWRASWSGRTVCWPSRSSRTRSSASRRPGGCRCATERSRSTTSRRRRFWRASRRRAPGSWPTATWRRSPTARQALELDSDEGIKRSVRAGLGIGFVSRRVVEEELDRGRARDVRDRGRRPDAPRDPPAAARRARAGAVRACVHRHALLLLCRERRRLHGVAPVRLSTDPFTSGKSRIAHLR